MSESDSIIIQINNHTRRLQKLKERQALEGNQADPALLIEIEDIEARLEQLQTTLDEHVESHVLIDTPYDEEDKPLAFNALSDILFGILLKIPTLQNKDNRDLLLRNLPANPVSAINRSMAPMADISQIISVVSTWGRLESGDWALAVVANNAQLLAQGTAHGQQLETWQLKFNKLTAS